MNWEKNEVFIRVSSPCYIFLNTLTVSRYNVKFEARAQSIDEQRNFIGEITHEPWQRYESNYTTMKFNRQILAKGHSFMKNGEISNLVISDPLVGVSVINLHWWSINWWFKSLRYIMYFGVRQVWYLYRKVSRSWTFVHKNFWSPPCLLSFRTFRCNIFLSSAFSKFRWIFCRYIQE